MALKSDGTVWSWGGNAAGQLGDGTTATHTSPVEVVGPGGTGFLKGVAAVAIDYTHSVAAKTDGTAWAWGDNTAGQLGNGTLASSSSPVKVVGPGGTGFLTGVTGVAAGVAAPGPGFAHSMAMTSAGAVYGWGDDTFGELGNGTTGCCFSAPVAVVGPGGVGTLAGVVAVATGYSHSLALAASTAPPPAVPEAPLMIELALTGIGLAGGAWYMRRRPRELTGGDQPRVTGVS